MLFALKPGHHLGGSVAEQYKASLLTNLIQLGQKSKVEIPVELKVIEKEATAAVAHSVNSPELWSLKELQQSRHEFDSQL